MGISISLGLHLGAINMAAANLPFGQLYTSGGSGTQTPGTSFALMNQWVSDGLSSAGVTPVAASDKITITETGIYWVLFGLSFAGTSGSVVDARLYLDGVQQPQVSFRRKLGVSGDVGVAPGDGFIDVTAGGVDIDVRVQCDGVADVFDLKEGSLSVIRIANT